MACCGSRCIFDDRSDSVSMHQHQPLFPPRAVSKPNHPRLSWQERKAEPFTVTPLHCGSSYLGYRETKGYGDPNGISLGTAVAISGAAASPNMGYHSSPAITFLMALFNVRLGWWLGNPKKNTYM